MRFSYDSLRQSFEVIFLGAECSAQARNDRLPNWAYYDKTHPSPLGGLLMPYTDTETGTAKEKRAARDKARNQAKQLETGQKPSKRKKPGKTPFGSFIKAKNWRNGKNRGEFFFDLIMGPTSIKGAWYNALTGQLQTSTCPLERRRLEIQRPYFTNVLRPILTRSLEAAIREKKGKPQNWRLPRSMRFDPPARQPRRSRSLAAA